MATLSHSLPPSLSLPPPLLQALDEEKVLFQRASNRMIYMNVSTLALKRIRNQTAARLAQLKEAAMKEHKEDGSEAEKVKESDHLLGAGGGGGKGGSKMLKMEGGGGEGKALVDKTTAVGIEKKNLKGWRLLEAELQSSFGGDTNSTPAVDSGVKTSSSGAAASEFPAPQHSAVFSSSQFYSKKSQKSSTSSVEGAEVGKIKSRKAHSKKKVPSKANVTKSDSGDHFSQKLAEIDRLPSSAAASINPASKELASQKLPKVDQHQTLPSSITDKQPGSREVADSKKVKKSKLKKDKHPQKKARHSTDGASSAESLQRDSLSESKEVTKSRPASLSSTPNVNTCSSATAVQQSATRRLSEVKESLKQATSTGVVSKPTGNTTRGGQTALFRMKKLSVTLDSLKKFGHSSDAIPSSMAIHETGSEKARPSSKEEPTTVSPNANAEPAQDILAMLCEGQSSSWAEPMDTADLATELFGGSDSESEREEGERAAAVSDIIQRIVSEEEGGEEPTTTDSDEVSYSQGISFDSALCGVGVAKTKRRGSLSKKMKGAKKHKKKLKSISSDGVRASGCSDGKKGGHPTQLDLSVFNRKSPTVRLAKTPTQSRGFPLSPTSSSGQATPTDHMTPTGHMTSSGPTTPTDDVSHTEAYLNEGKM